MKKILLVLAIISMGLFCFAESIVLNSGKTVTGKILEKTDKSIKVDVESIPVTYYFDEIKTIDGSVLSKQEEKITVVDNTKAVEAKKIEEENLKLKNWDNWLKSVEDYLKQVQAISREFHQIGEEAGTKMAPLDKKSKMAVLDEMLQKCELLKKRSEILSPPPELREYHEKFLKSVDLYLEFTGSLGKSEVNKAEIFQKLQNNAIGSMEDLRAAYVSHGAPSELISQMDIVISRGKQLMEKMQQDIKKIK
ncbi:MAG: hypothetical protein PHT53_05765 [Candidatus Omnitrophica bacterium]|nr:hypothetical protein [Candidatus Omnitrophota bacterium]